MRLLLKTFFGVAFLLTFAATYPAAAHPTSAIVLTQTCHSGVFDFQYPRVVGMADSIAQNKINSVITHWVDKVRTETDTPYTETSMIRYEVHYNKEGKLSLTLISYNYTGGAHGMSFLRGMTFDLATGNEYSLSDIIPYTGEGREKINREISRRLSEGNIPLISTFKGVKDRQDFYLAADGKAVVFFQLYELAPYVYGFLKFPITI